MGRKKSKRTSSIRTSNFLIMQLEDGVNEQKKKYKTKLSPIIEDIYKGCVMLDEDETKVLNERLQKVLQSFVEKMKEVDNTFEEVFERIEYTGSFYDGLRITEATEFDINLVLKPKFEMELLRRNRPPGFVTVRVFPTLVTMTRAPYKDWMLRDGATDMYLLNPNAVRAWFQGVVAKTLNKVEEEEGNSFSHCQLKLRQSGPACTLVVTGALRSHKTIEIDLVPALESPSTKRGINPGLMKDDIRKIGLDKTWFAVPKPPTANCPCRMCISWRMSFPIQESDVIKDLKFFKYSLRMIKRVRDELGMHEVASYYIKTLFLLELQNQGPQFFEIYDRGLLFMHMLESLKKALEIGKIPFLWNNNCNLLGKVSRETLTNNAGKLKHFCDKINRLVDEEDDAHLRRFIEETLLNPSQDKSKVVIM